MTTEDEIIEQCHNALAYCPDRALTFSEAVNQALVEASIAYSVRRATRFAEAGSSHEKDGEAA